MSSTRLIQLCHSIVGPWRRSSENAMTNPSTARNIEQEYCLHSTHLPFSSAPEFWTDSIYLTSSVYTPISLRTPIGGSVEDVGYATARCLLSDSTTTADSPGKRQNREDSSQQPNARYLLYLSWPWNSTDTVHAKANHSKYSTVSAFRKRKVPKVRHKLKGTDLVCDEANATKEMWQNQYGADLGANDVRK